VSGVRRRHGVAGASRNPGKRAARRRVPTRRGLVEEANHVMVKGELEFTLARAQGTKYGPGAVRRGIDP
jgi:hypothetical protein